MANDDLISRQAALDSLDAICDRECEYPKKQRVVMCAACHLGSAFDAIEDLPSAQPEIIRCKDCKYYRWEINMCDEPFSTAHNVVHEYDYCSKAERKTDG